MVLKRSQRPVVVFVIAMLLIAMSFSVCGSVSAGYEEISYELDGKNVYDFGDVPIGGSGELEIKMTYSATILGNGPFSLDEGHTFKVCTKDEQGVYTLEPLAGSAFGYEEVKLSDNAGIFTFTFSPKQLGKHEQTYYIGLFSDESLIDEEYDLVPLQFTVTGNGVENEPIVSPQTADPATAIPVIGLLLSGAGIIIFSRKKLMA